MLCVTGTRAHVILAASATTISSIVTYAMCSLLSSTERLIDADEIRNSQCHVKELHKTVDVKA